MNEDLSFKGEGFFETLLYNGKHVCHLDLHLERIFGSLKYFSLKYDVIDFKEAIDELIRNKSLEGRQARVNIYYPILSYDAVIVPQLKVFPYTPRSLDPLRLCVYPFPHDSFLTKHKSMSYFPYSLAKRYAQDQGFDDAIIIDNQGNVAETATCALLFKIKNQWHYSGVKNKLKSVSLGLAKKVLGDVKPLMLTMDDLNTINTIDSIYVLNSLMGIRPVSDVEGVTTFVDWNDCEELNNIIIGL